MRNTVTIDKKTYDVPQTWNELSLRDLHKCYAAVMTDAVGAVLPDEQMLLKKQMLIELLFGLDGAQLDEYRAGLEVENEEERDALFFETLKALYDLVTPAFFERMDDAEDDSTPEQYAVRLGLTKNPYRELKLKGKIHLNQTGKRNSKTYRAPADLLDNLTIYEMGYAFTAYEAWLNADAADKENALDYLLAVIYREPKPPTRGNRESGYGGDIRRPLLGMESMIEQRQKKMKHIEPRVKQIVAFWFASCRQVIIERNPDIFRAPTGESSGRDFGWGGLLIELAQGIVNLDEVSRQPYQNAFLYLAQLEEKRRRAAMKKS